MTAKDFRSRLWELSNDELEHLRDIYKKKHELTKSPRSKFLLKAAEDELKRRGLNARLKIDGSLN